MVKRANRQIYVICDNIRSLYNVGAIFRTSDGAGVDKIYLTGMTGYPKQNDHAWAQTPRIAKTSLGAEKTVNWKYVLNPLKIIQKLKKHGVIIYALENNISGLKSENLWKVKFKFPLALIVGHEVKGIKPELFPLVDYFIQIPMYGVKESLNVAVAYGIAIYEIIRQKKAKINSP